MKKRRKDWVSSYPKRKKRPRNGSPSCRGYRPGHHARGGRSGPGAHQPARSQTARAHSNPNHIQRGSPSDLTRRETTPPVGVAELATPRDAAVAEQTHNSVSERVAEIKSKKRSCTGSPSGPPSFTTSAYHDFVASGWGPMTPTFPSPNGTTIAAASPLV